MHFSYDNLGRLVRLIPDNGDDPERIAIKTLFNHRLPKDSREARLEWLDIVEGTSDLWGSISSPKRELIRSFLNTVNLEVVKRARPSSTFNFSSASIGNLFLTGYTSPALSAHTYRAADTTPEVHASFPAPWNQPSTSSALLPACPQKLPSFPP
jgi:hypothetical protein